MPVALDVNRLVRLIDEFDLLAILFTGGISSVQPKTVGQREGWLHMPGVAEIDVVIREWCFDRMPG